MKARSASAVVASVLVALAFAPSAGATFPGRNGDLLFAQERFTQPARFFDLYASRPGGGPARRLTRTPGEDELDPAASPDGRLIAYTRVSRAHRGSRIWIARRDGSHRTSSSAAASPPGRRTASGSCSSGRGGRRRSPRST